MKRMHRWIAWALALALTCGLMPMSLLANATEQTDEIIGLQDWTSGWVNPLYEGVISLEDLEFLEIPDVDFLAARNYVSEDEAVQEMRDHMTNREEVFQICVLCEDGNAQAQFDRMWEAVMTHTGNPVEGDYLNRHWGGASIIGFDYEFVGDYIGFCYTFSISYYTTTAQEEELDAAVEALLDEIILDGMTDYEKVCAVYDYMCANITYDHENLKDTSYLLKYSAYAALVNKTAVCQGYASLFYRLMLELDVDARYISGIGNGGGHGWNIVELDGLYYNVDATWDSSWYQAGLDYNYFLRNEDNFTEGGTDHFRNEEYKTAAFMAEYPMSETDYTPHTYENGFCIRCDVYEEAVYNAGVYEISNAGQLYWFAQQVNQGDTIINGKLMADIVVNGDLMDKITIDTSGNATVNNGCTVREWTPIGNADMQYTGIFEGNGKSVSGLYFNKPDTSSVGLFGHVGRGGIVRNVSVVNSYFCGRQWVAGVVGGNKHGTIENCYNSSAVTGEVNVGGVAGDSTSAGSVTNCCNTGTIIGGRMVGGIVGCNSGTVMNCYNTGAVTGDTDVGGVSGSNSGTVSNCYNTSAVNGGTDVGGVVGYNFSTVLNCYNTGTVNGETCPGGVVGLNFLGTVTNCYYLESACAGGIDGEDVTGEAEARTEAQFASGQVAYLLQSGQPANVWGQKIGTDASPVFSDAEVFFNAENNIYFNADTQGDLNGDGVANSEDLTLLARHVGRIESLEGQALLNADVNGDGEVDAEDLTKHARYVGRIISSWDQE